MGLQAGASAATLAGSEARGSEGGTTGVGGGMKTRGGGAREAGTREGGLRCRAGGGAWLGQQPSP